MSQKYTSYYLGPWLVEPHLLQLSRKGEVKKIEPQLMSVLEELTANPYEVVSKERLMNQVWAGVIVSENTLTRAISSLRKALEDNRSNPQYIETISKTGYRLIAPVRPKTGNRFSEFSTSYSVRNVIMLVFGVILLVSASLFATRKSSSAYSPKMYHPSALANYSNSEYWPAISPDGKYAAYCWKGEKDDNWDVYVKQMNGEARLRITENSAVDLRPKWSNDGSFIYFIRYENGQNTIYKKALLGEKEIRVIAAPPYSYGDFDISPDEKWLAFNDRENEEAPLRIKLISLENGAEQWLSQLKSDFKGDIHPRFSSDGKSLAFIREKNSTSMQLWTVNLNSGKNQQITSEHISINGFDWSEDGKSLLYSSDKTGLYKIWKASLKTGKSELLPIGDYQLVMPRMSQTGRLIYAKMEDNINIWSYSPDKEALTPWRFTNELNINPAISPDGKKVSFTMNKDGVFQIWVANRDGSEAVPITNFQGEYLSTPRWSHDGKQIVFKGYKCGQADIYIVNAEGGIAKNLTQSPSDDYAPFFTRDKIYFSSNRSGEWGIWRMNINGSKPEAILHGNVYGPQVNSDETSIFYCKKEEFGLWVYDLNSREEKLLIQEFHPMYWSAFAVVKNGIYYFNHEEKQFEYFNLHSGESKVIYHPKSRIPRLGISLSVASDGKELLFTQIDHHDADIMVCGEVELPSLVNK